MKEAKEKNEITSWGWIIREGSSGSNHDWTFKNYAIFDAKCSVHAFYTPKTLN